MRKAILISLTLCTAAFLAGCGAPKPPSSFWQGVQQLRTEFVRGGVGVQRLDVNEDGTMMTVTIGRGWLLFDNMQKRNIVQNFRMRLIQLRSQNEMSADEWVSCYIVDAAGGRLAKANPAKVEVYE